MLFWIIVFMLVLLLVLLVSIVRIPFMTWLSQAKARHYGNTARRNIEIIKKNASSYNNGNVKPGSNSKPIGLICIAIVFIVSLLFVFGRMANPREESIPSEKDKPKKENISSEQNKPSYYTGNTDDKEKKPTTGYATEKEHSKKTSEESSSFYDTGIVFADSSSRYLSSEEIEALESGYTYSAEDMVQYAINEIYAREGYGFKEQYWKDYYSQFSWYHNLGYSDEETRNRFNKFEKENMKKLVNKRDQIRSK